MLSSREIHNISKTYFKGSFMLKGNDCIPLHQFLNMANNNEDNQFNESKIYITKQMATQIGIGAARVANAIGNDILTPNEYEKILLLVLQALDKGIKITITKTNSKYGLIMV